MRYYDEPIDEDECGWWRPRPTSLPAAYKPIQDEEYEERGNTRIYPEDHQPSELWQEMDVRTGYPNCYLEDAEEEYVRWNQQGWPKDRDPYAKSISDDNK